MLCKHCLAIAKTLVCYQHCFGHRSKTCAMLAAMKEINSIPARPRISHYADDIVCITESQNF